MGRRHLRSGEGGPRDIAWLVHWALVDQGGLGELFAADGRESLSWMDLGVRIDRSVWSGSLPMGRGQSGGVAHPDTSAVLEAIGQLDREAAALVVHFGRLGWGSEAQPEWCPEGEGELRQALTAKGQPRWIWADPQRRKGKREPLMEFVGTRPEVVRMHRAEYECWWLALRTLRRHLAEAGRMTSWLPTGPAAPREPWSSAARPRLLPVNGEGAKQGA